MQIEPTKLKQLIRRLVGYAISRGLKRPEAEDCAQEAALVLIRKYPDKDETELVPLSFRIIRWKIHEYRRKPSSVHEARAVPLDDTQIEAKIAKRNEEETNLVKEAFYATLAKLGKKCRSLLLWQLEGYSGNEIAEKLGVKTRNAAYIAINRCKAKFRKHYKGLIP